MMKTAICYYSYHHNNTKKLLDAIVEKNSDVVLIDVSKNPEADLFSYDRIGFASGIYFSAFAKEIIAFASENLPENKDVFYIYTHGAPSGNFLRAMREIAEKRNCRELGYYHCRGFDTTGPFKMLGGIAKGHPTDEEIEGAVRFYQGL